MRLYIKREQEKRGLLKKKITYNVTSQLQCSEEERSAIKLLEIGDYYCLAPYEIDGEPAFRGRCGAWADSNSAVSHTAMDLLHARDIEQELREKATWVNDLVKDFIDSGGKVELEETIEL